VNTEKTLSWLLLSTSVAGIADSARCGLLLQTSRRSVVYLYVGHDREPGKSGWTDPNAVARVKTPVDRKNHVLPRPHYLATTME